MRVQSIVRWNAGVYELLTFFQSLNVAATLNNKCHEEVSLSVEFIASEVSTTREIKSGNTFGDCSRKFSRGLWNKASARWMAWRIIQIRLETDEPQRAFARERCDESFAGQWSRDFTRRLSSDSGFFIFSHWYQVKNTFSIGRDYTPKVLLTHHCCHLFPVSDKHFFKSINLTTWKVSCREFFPQNNQFSIARAARTSLCLENIWFYLHCSSRESWNSS